MLNTYIKQYFHLLKSFLQYKLYKKKFNIYITKKIIKLKIIYFVNLYNILKNKFLVTLNK